MIHSSEYMAAKSGSLVRLVSLVLLTCASLAHAQTPDGQTPQAEWPQKLVITVGDIRTRIDGPKMWTLSGVDFQGHMMATEESAYGTVFTIRNVGHLGTAHFLDVPGKPGEIEKENVTSLRFFVDEKPVVDFSPTMDLEGKSFRMERTSKIRGFDLESSVSLRDNILIETARLHATAPLDLQKAHAIMYAWTPKATVYVFGNEDGIQRRGEFLKEGQTIAEVVKSMRWFAFFDPGSGTGGVFTLRELPSNDIVEFLLVDSPGLYRKVALYSLVDQIVPVGWDGTYQSAVGFFSATEAEWEQKALQREAELRGYETGKSAE